MSLSVRTRFEVFKRDRFTCGYCGKHPPDVLLEVDHIVPRAAGGPDAMENLVTACWDCNHGKSDRLLDEGSGPTTPATGDVQQQITRMQERIEQAQAYLELVGVVDQLRNQQRDLVMEQWAKAWGGGLSEDKGTYTMPEGGYWPDDRSLRNLMRRLPLDVVFEAIDITAMRFPRRASYDATRYFYGVCWRMIREREQGQ